MNFILHPDRGGAQRTDADIVGVRFPYREELGWTERPLVDHPVFARSPYVELVIAEVKSARDYCQINGPWTDPQRGNMAYVLRALGVFPGDRVNAIAKELYARYLYSDDTHRVRLLAFGERRNSDLHPAIVQMTWATDVLPFVYDRFKRHVSQKSQNEQWDETGRALFRYAVAARGLGEFSDQVLRGVS